MSELFDEALDAFAAWAEKTSPCPNPGGINYNNIRRSQAAKFILSTEIESIDEYYSAGVDLIKIGAFVLPYEWCYFELTDGGCGDTFCMLVDRYELGRLYVWPGVKHMPDGDWRILESVNMSDEYIRMSVVKGTVPFKEYWHPSMFYITICCIAAAITNGPVFTFIPPVDTPNPLSKKAMH